MEGTVRNCVNTTVTMTLGCIYRVVTGRDEQHCTELHNCYHDDKLYRQGV